MPIDSVVEDAIRSGDLVPIYQYSSTHLNVVVDVVNTLVTQVCNYQLHYICMLVIAYCKERYRAEFSPYVEEFYCWFRNLMIANT